MNDAEPRVLIFVGVYLPGFKAGGPIRSIANLVDHMGENVDFSVLTSDRDLGDLEPYSSVRPGTWSRVGKAEVMYLPRGFAGLNAVWKVLKSRRYNIIYLNSFFSPLFSILPLVLTRILFPHMPLIVAPRGELATGALGLKKFKKRLYIVMANLLGLYRGVAWHATSSHEETHIRHMFGEHVRAFMLPNLTAIDREGVKIRRIKQSGQLKVVFLSRVSRMKNLAWAIKLLTAVKGAVEYHIYGPCEDAAYWEQCRATAASLPPTVQVVYHGAVDHTQVRQVLSEYDLFFVPTLGENFGHAILEALRAGCPVLISDKTPWRHLQESGAGWDIPLDCPEKFVTALQTVIDMDGSIWNEWSDRARQFGWAASDGTALRDAYQQMFFTQAQVTTMERHPTR